MASYSMTSLHVDLNDAAKCVDREFAHSYKIQNGDDIWPNLRKFINQFMKVGEIKTWKELTIGVQQFVRLIILSTPDLSFKCTPSKQNMIEN